MTIRPSRGRSLLVASLAAGGLRALALCELPAPLFAALALGVIGLAASDIAAARRPTRLALDGDGRWHLDRPDGERFAGRLAEAGYRSAAVIVLELERDGGEEGGPTRSPWRSRRAWRTRRGRRRRLTVFADSVDAADFSFLHLQLAFGAGGARTSR